ncbi:MAG: hypothetical protein COB24_02005 [Hyphomicrobiales bacterium]|nr:MAG: hypothetical protein COB24_02005 [Hyphomicrobiales bacterium]
MIGGNSQRIGVCGDSAGGNLTAIICQQMALSGGTMPHLQVLKQVTRIIFNHRWLRPTS